MKTEAGKAISRYNAQKHAILRQTLTEYEKTDAEGLFNDLSLDMNPAGRMQELLIEIIAANTIKLYRIAKAESELIRTAIEPGMKLPSISGYDPILKIGIAEKLDIYSRYQTATENRVYRALTFFHQLKSHEQSKKTTE